MYDCSIVLPLYTAAKTFINQTFYSMRNVSRVNACLPAKAKHWHFLSFFLYVIHTINTLDSKSSKCSMIYTSCSLIAGTVSNWHIYMYHQNHEYWWISQFNEDIWYGAGNRRANRDPSSSSQWWCKVTCMFIQKVLRLSVLILLPKDSSKYTSQVMHTLPKKYKRDNWFWQYFPKTTSC